MEQAPIEGLLTTKEVVALTGLSRSTIWRRRQDEVCGFPQPCDIGGNQIRWRTDEMRGWINNLPRCGTTIPINANSRRLNVGRP